MYCISGLEEDFHISLPSWYCVVENEIRVDCCAGWRTASLCVPDRVVYFLPNGACSVLVCSYTCTLLGLSIIYDIV